VIDNKDKLFNHLFLILDPDGILPGRLPRSRKDRQGSTTSQPKKNDDIPILEIMTRAFYYNPDKLSNIAAFIRDISEGKDSSFIPEDYLKLIEIFKKAAE
jgi:hypothetical protein